MAVKPCVHRWAARFRTATLAKNSQPADWAMFAQRAPAHPTYPAACLAATRACSSISAWQAAKSGGMIS